MDIYKTGIRPLLFSGLNADPESVHHQTLRVLNWLDDGNQIWSHWARQSLIQLCRFQHPALMQSVWGLPFANPMGLAAGFDKDGVAAGIWSSFGFGFAELGTVTLHAQPGNPPPRLFRLPLDQAALNRMGFNNQGAAALAARLTQKEQDWRQELDNPQFSHSQMLHPIPLGINLGKSKITPLEEAAQDYLGSFRLLKPLGDYFVVNVSSPNTPGLRSLQAAALLDPILSLLQQENQYQKPLLVKIAPDLEWEEIEAVLALAQAHRLAGIIATNTTIRRDLKTQTIMATGQSVSAEAGGISGAPVRERATEVIRFIYRQTQGKLPIIGVGGIFTAEDAWEKLTAGASLLQVYTGWIYEGPWMVQRILTGLVQKLEAQGFKHLSEAVGIESIKP